MRLTSVTFVAVLDASAGVVALEECRCAHEQVRLYLRRIMPHVIDWNNLIESQGSEKNKRLLKTSAPCEQPLDCYGVSAQCVVNIIQ